MMGMIEREDGAGLSTGATEMNVRNDLVLGNRSP
jgi:hypothetical protein